ncbi:conserved hypothetical protein [Magnetospirillum molischianum DSM 120]|uniref:Uncharacterized protein n=1 Tax=Magnetospirillum molischianum DSM 120 TaxID=1150626 RepID=H8FP34_MAGML|nr:conserved hypothetical protein [Magnetospirillum molischianum DSM 120]
MVVSPRQSPRISANQLAQYMVSSDTARLGIIRKARDPQTPVIIRYRDARAPICAFLSDQQRKLNPLTAAEDMLQQRSDDPSESPFRKDDAKSSIEVIRAIQRMGNSLSQYEFHLPPSNQDKLYICGVEISIRADLVVYGSSRGVKQIGAAVLRMTQDDADTDAARDKRRDMGCVVATLTKLHVEKNLSGERLPVNKLCMSIDVQHGELFVAPNANTRRMNDIESVCRVISEMWDKA